MIQAGEKDTILVQRSINNMVRVMKNGTAAKVADMEARGATLDELLPVISGKKGREAQMSGDLDGGIFSVGQALGLVEDIMEASEIVKQTVAEAIEQIEKINRNIIC